MKSRVINILKFLIGWPLSFIALYFIYRTFAPQLDDISVIGHVHFWSLGTGIILFIAYYFLRSYIWVKLLEYQGHRIRFRDSNYLWLLAQLKRYIPGNIWSYLGLAVTYSERQVPKKAVAYAVWIESELVIIATFILSLLAVPFVLKYFISIPIPHHVTIMLLALLFFIGAGIYLFLGKWLKHRTGKSWTVIRHIFSTFSPRENFVLLLLMGATYVIYGLGYYFTIAALVPLDPEHLLTYVGIFIFSLVAGYLSIVTPTGLGVREGFITLGLAKFVPVGIAGFAAIFSRIIIVLSELMTLLLSYLWYKAGKQGEKWEQFLTRYVHEVLLLLATFVYMLYFSIISVLRYNEYYTGRFDLGNMAQTVWNTYHGRLFQLTDPNGTEIVSRLAFHADFILILLSPFYLLWEDPRMLLIIQAIIVGAGAFFVYGISRQILQEKTLSLVIALAYLLNPSVQRATIYDFHAVVLATTFLLGAVYFLLKKRFRWFLGFALLAALTKEQLWFTIALFGPILFFIYRKRLFGTVMFLSCLGVFYFLLWQAIPDAAGASHFALSYFSEGGESPSDIIKHIIFSPVSSLQTALAPERIAYYQKLLLPVGYLPVFYPIWLILAAPDIVLNVFSDRSQLQQIYYQYTAIISAFLFISLIYSVPVVKRIIPRVPFLFFSLYIGTMALIGAYLYGPLPGGKEPNLAMVTKKQPERVLIDHELAKIPQAASVAASNNLASHLSHRERVYVIPNGIGRADYVAIFTSGNNTNANEAVAITQVVRDNRYEKYFESKQLQLYRKKD